MKFFIEGHYAALLTHDYPDLVDYQVLVYPCLHVNKMPILDSEKEFTNDCYILVQEVIKYFVSNLIESEAILGTAHISPLLKSNFVQLPKTFIAAAELDPLVDQSRAYFEKLQQHNVECELVVIKGVFHGFFSNPVLMKNSFDELKQHIVDFYKRL